jgi:hypothetical protein
MHETKVNTNIGDVSSPEAKKPVLPPEYAGLIETPVGVHALGAVTSVHSHSGPISLIYGVDVAQLLRDIDEASAGTNPVELFRLCLDAQRVLGQVQGGNTTQDEAELLTAYRASDDDSRRFLQSAAQTLAHDFKRQRARLTLMQSGHIQCAEDRA